MKAKTLLSVTMAALLPMVWDWQTLRDVPDRLDGHFTLMPIYLK